MTASLYTGSAPATTAPAPAKPLEARLVRRLVTGGAAHTREVVGPIQSPLGAAFTEALYDVGSGELVVPLDAQDPDVRAALGGIHVAPIEIHLAYTDALGGLTTWKGPVVGWQQVRLREAGLGLRLKALGLGHYLEGLALPTRGPAGRFVAVAEDLTTIAGDALAGAQADGAYSNFGFALAATGSPVPDDDVDLPTYTPLMTLLRSLADQDGTCDVTATTAPGDADGDAPPVLRLDYPRRGQDRTATVIVDRRAIVDPAWALSAGLDDFATQIRAVGRLDDAEAVKVRTNTAAEAAWGRRFLPVPAGTDIVTDAALGRYADQALASRRAPAVLSAPTLLASANLELAAFGLGDTIEIDYDPGIGLAFTGPYRVTAYTVAVDDVTGGARLDLAVVPEEP